MCLVPEPGYAPALDLRSPPLPTPELRPEVAGRRRGKVTEGGTRKEITGDSPLPCRGREREPAGASACAMLVGWGWRGMAPQRSVAGVVRRCRSGERSEGKAYENGVRLSGRMISIITDFICLFYSLNTVG